MSASCLLVTTLESVNQTLPFAGRKILSLRYLHKISQSSDFEPGTIKSDVPHQPSIKTVQITPQAQNTRFWSTSPVRRGVSCHVNFSPSTLSSPFSLTDRWAIHLARCRRRRPLSLPSLVSPSPLAAAIAPVPPPHRSLPPLPTRCRVISVGDSAVAPADRR
jgi:hypothetical protein